MIRLAILIVFLTNLSFGQTNTDYQLYSQVINNFINAGIEHDVETSQVVVITKYVPDENEVSYYGKEFLGSDDPMINMVLHYDTLKVKLFKDIHVQDAVKLLEKEFYETPSLDKNKFDLNPTVSAISSRQYERYFKTIFGRRLTKGWKKFYKRYPGSHGVFEFSKVVYNDNYACFYVGRHSNNLSGSGDLVIARQINGKWSILTYVNIWMS